jgi:putative redox protein
MKSEITWRGSRFTFDGKSRSHGFVLDSSTATGGGDLGPTPKELVLAAICGCTGIDVVGLLRKAKVQIESLRISAEAESIAEHPKVFNGVDLLFDVSGGPELREPLIDAVEKSESLYCGVSAMIAKSCAINYRILLNGEEIYRGKASFPA